MAFQMHPDICAALGKLLGPITPPPIEIGDIESRRMLFEGLIETNFADRPLIEGVEVMEVEFQAQDGHQLKARWYTSTLRPAPGSAVLYIHGGGFIALSPEHYDPIVRGYVASSGVPMLSLGYRLAPEVQAPISVRDCHAGLQYLNTHARELGIDPTRIGIMGDHAGGGLTAALAHYAKEQNGPFIKLQILLNPMLNDLNTDPSCPVYQAIAPYLIWNMDDNITAWQAWLGRKTTASDPIPPTHAPFRATVEQLKGLPTVYMDVGELDLVRDECLQYARSLGQAGVACELHLFSQVSHGFELLAPESEIAKRVMGRRYEVLREL